ncbi:class E sortase [Streptomyces sp. FB2]|uniref:class E sortase n=1 Tax=Streptomyces sp. FB2 TaxID=2902454 RepID=UPI001F2800FA|nr:class E sortase [Streptomyces sp. FB2]MCF2537044.1 class E sortase [Streptomyces sp. FB2]
MAERVRVVRHGRLRRRAVVRRVVWSAGEVLVTVGAVLALLVVHQVWWTNREARASAEREVRALERDWGDQRDGADQRDGGDQRDGPHTRGPTAASDGSRTTVPPAPADPRTLSTKATRTRPHAVLSIPRLHLRVPVAEGVARRGVLDQGWVGHYPGTQQPGEAGNVGLAGHRNTHGEPFRRLDRLGAGDVVRIETRAAVHTYAVDRVLPRTTPGDGGVLAPVPRSGVVPGYGYTTPGHYLTLTTCTPQFTSTYRLVVWAKLVSVRGR